MVRLLLAFWHWILSFFRTDLPPAPEPEPPPALPEASPFEYPEVTAFEPLPLRTIIRLGQPGTFRGGTEGEPHAKI